MPHVRLYASVIFMLYFMINQYAISRIQNMAGAIGEEGEEWLHVVIVTLDQLNIFLLKQHT